VKALVKTSMMIALLWLVLSVMAALAPEMSRIAASEFIAYKSLFYIAIVAV
jgi:hypothetical protein